MNDSLISANVTTDNTFSAWITLILFFDRFYKNMQSHLFSMIWDLMQIPTWQDVWLQFLTVFTVQTLT